MGCGPGLLTQQVLKEVSFDGLRCQQGAWASARDVPPDSGEGHLSSSAKAVGRELGAPTWWGPEAVLSTQTQMGGY